MIQEASVISTFFVALLAGTSGSAQDQLPIGPPGLAAMYRIAEAVPAASSIVETLSAALGSTEVCHGAKGQWLHLRADKRIGSTFEVWLLCAGYPPTALPDAQGKVLRYLLRQGYAAPVEFRHEVTGRAVLPSTGAWPHLLPRAASATDARDHGPFPQAVTYLGHRYLREGLEEGPPATPPEGAALHLLRPDMLIGVPHNTRQVDETRRYDDSDYEYVPLTREDYRTMITAGLNCFRAEPDYSSWLEDAGVFYWGVGGADVAYPECLYQPQYIGPALFFDEPAVVTRDRMIRPRLRDDASFRKSISPQAAFEKHFAEAVENGAPTRLLAGLAGRDDVDMGAMLFPQSNIYTWETMISSAAYQLLYDPATPNAIVFEPPGQLGTRRTLPPMNMVYGCQIPVTGRDHFVDIIIAFLRGAARASGKEWGVSVYGGVDRTEASALLSRAYESGATRFFFWDTHRLACVPFGEVMALSRHLAVHGRNYPHRDLDRLRNAAEVAILLPPGYNLGHVFMGKGLLWGVGELNLERRNREGVSYRTVMGNFFTEIERCLRLGLAFDLLWDLPSLRLTGYREIIRVREDGKLQILQGGQEALIEGPRLPERPEGAAPQLKVALSASEAFAPCTIEASAHVVEGGAPVYYAPAPDAEGVHHNIRVLWELFGPNEEDYEHRAPSVEPGPVTARADRDHVVTAKLNIRKPGHYRLRAATTDLAGRSTVVWKELTIGE